MMHCRRNAGEAGNAAGPILKPDKRLIAMSSYRDDEQGLRQLGQDRFHVQVSTEDKLRLPNFRSNHVIAIPLSFPSWLAILDPFRRATGSRPDFNFFALLLWSSQRSVGNHDDLISH